MSYQAAVHAINSAQIKDSERLFAVALLSAIHPATGAGTVPWAALTETISRKTVRNRLASLAAAGILDYKTGADVFIMFPSWGDKVPPTGDRIPPTRDSQSLDQSPPDGKSPPHGTLSPTGGTESPPDGINGDHVSLLDHTSSPKQENNKQTAPEPDEHAANLALLADANVNGFNRTAIANRYSFPDLMAHVMAYRAERSLGKVKGPGALVSRCLKRYGVDPITGAAPVDELYDKHVTPQALATYAAGMPAPGTTKWTLLAAKLQADDHPQEQREPEGETDPRPIAQPVTVTSHPIWPQALAELALQMTPATFDAWLANTAMTLREGDDTAQAVATIYAPNTYAVEWLGNRLHATIERTLASILRHGVVVQIRLNSDHPQANEKPETVTNDDPRPNNNSQFSILNSNLPTPHPDGQALWEEARASLLGHMTTINPQRTHLLAATCTDYHNGNGAHLTLTAPPASADQLRAHLLGPIRREIARVKETGQVTVRIIAPAAS